MSNGADYDRNRGLGHLIAAIPAPILGFSFSAMLVVLLSILALTATAYIRDEAIEFAGLRFGKVQDNRPLMRALLMIDGECSELGKGWKAHDGLRGRFPIGAGQGTDIKGAVMTFSVNQEDMVGEYAHKLIPDEMPKHTHTQDGTDRHSRRCAGNCDSLVASASKQTGSRGGDKPHNNIPPFFVVNFCKLSPEPHAS